MKAFVTGWQFWALLSAGFAALTAIFGKIGVESIDSNFATLIRTVLILGLVTAVAAVTGAIQPVATVPARTWAFLTLSGLATGASWLCYYRALKLGPASGVVSIDKLSGLLVALFAVVFLGERLGVKGSLGVVLIAAGAVLVAIRS